jgi:hypothetical protein
MTPRLEVLHDGHGPTKGNAAWAKLQAVFGYSNLRMGPEWDRRKPAHSGD